jgi:hypothetical protein
MSGEGLALAGRRIGSILLFGVIPALVILVVLGTTYDKSTFLYDFRGDLYNAGHAILHGHDPYRAAFLHHLAEIKRAGGHPTTSFAVPVYPAPALLAVTPLAILPYHAAGILFTLLSIAAFAGGLWLLGVRDWRCYGAAFLSWPVVHSLRLGQVNGFLVLGTALAWHWRGRLWPAAVAVASVVAAKVFLWPLGAWLLITRRWRTALLAVALAVVGSLVAWAVIGFDGLSSYPRMLSDLSSVEGTDGVSALSIGRGLGIGRTAAGALGWIACAGLLAGAWWCTRREDGDRLAFGFAVMAGLVSSPLVWPHYLALVFVPIALVAPTLSALWLVPLIGYLAPVEVTNGDLGKILPYVAIELIVVLSLYLQGLNRPGEASTAVGRITHGLRSTSSRSHIAAQRPTTGP